MGLRGLLSTGSSSSLKSVKSHGSHSASSNRSDDQRGSGINSPRLKPHHSHEGKLSPPVAPVSSHRQYIFRNSSRGTISPQSTGSTNSHNANTNSNSNSNSNSHSNIHVDVFHTPQGSGRSSPVPHPGYHTPNTSVATPPNGSTKSTDSSSGIDSTAEKHPHESNHHSKAKHGGKSRKSDHAHHGHHLSLRRFLNKLKPSDSHSHSSHVSKEVPQVNVSSELYQKYGSIGKLLGTGASGSVSIVTSNSDPHKLYAVKKFRSKLPAESESDYKTKVRNEFKIGDFCRHPNLVHTYELIKEYPIPKKHRGPSTHKLGQDPEYFMVMEYCPYDFFNIVMSGLLEPKEIYCYFNHIVSGVAFLHENGLAHRDIKLDNCVVNNQGILKLIDYGSAVNFKKQLNDDHAINPHIDELLDDHHKLAKARGVVGSDPYISPEVFEPSNFGYDPRLADVWSVAIVFCCMVLKRFPWKLPKLSDPSYRSFAGVEDSDEKPKSTSENSTNSNSHTDNHSAAKSPRGPDRLLRLLPAESRELLRNMLRIDPAQRYLIHDVVKDDFFKSIDHCYTTADGKVVKSPTHEHHLVSEDDLHKITQEREKSKKLKEAGVE